MVQAVPGVVGMETSGSTVGRDAAGLSQSKRSTAAAAELVETLGAGEVETSSFGQAEDELTPGTFDYVVHQGGVMAVLLVLVLPHLEIFTRQSLVGRRPW